jgi:hypothetical protein
MDPTGGLGFAVHESRDLGSREPATHCIRRRDVRRVLMMFVVTCIAPLTLPEERAAAYEREKIPACMEAKKPVPPSTEPVAFPDTVAGRRAAAFIKAFNSGSDDLMRAFEADNRAKSALKRRSIDDRIKQHHELKSDWGTLKVGEIIAGGERDVSLIVYADAADEWLDFSFELEPDAPYGLVAILIKGPVPAPSETGKGVVLDSKMRAEVVDGTAKVLSEAYVFPDVGREMAELIRKNLSQGEYDNIPSTYAFTERLTEDLRGVCHDKHLRVEAGSQPSCCAGSEDGNAWWAKDRWENYGFEKVERLPGNVGYLKLNQFSVSKDAQETAAAAMNFLANCGALIFDLRENGGGSPEMIAFLSSYLFDKPVHLNSFYNRREDTTTETWTQDEVPGRQFGVSKPVYVLTSNYTFSGAEEFTYNLKNLKRATIVGETTGGGAHPVFRHPINDSFIVTVPYARAVNPITKTNWEGVGVEPDIKVPAGRALVVAQKAALERMIKSVTDARRTKALQGVLRRVEAELAALD